MSGWTKFTDNEIKAVKNKLNKQRCIGLKIFVFLSPLVCAVGPYLRNRRGGERMIDTMNHKDAVIQYAVIWLLILIGYWIWSNYETNKEFSELKNILRKKDSKTRIIRKSKSAYAFFDNILITEMEGELERIRIVKKQSGEFGVGNNIQIEYEDQTNAIFKVRKVN